MSWKLKEKYREVLSREDGYSKKVWVNDVTVCLAYPNLYRTGMSNLGFQTVYDLFNRQPGCLCERVFLPDREDEDEFRQGGLTLFSLESQTPLSEFDIVAFSIPFENDYPNILKMLEMGGIPLLSRERDGKAPLIMGGGIAVTLNPEPLADFFDLFIIGEAEEAVAQFVRQFRTAFDSGLAGEELLLKLQREMEGVYVPRFYSLSYGQDHRIEKRAPLFQGLPEKIKKLTIADINAFATDQSILTKDAELGKMFLIEVSRGCGRGCRFCAAGFVCRPVRFRKAETVKASIGKMPGPDMKFGLLGTAVSDHPHLLEMCRFIRERQGKISVSSLRLDRISRELLILLKEGGAETLSLAPEAGSQRLRDSIRKGISEEHIFRAVELMTDCGISQIRLYFMVGLPGEEDEDIEAIINLTKKIKHSGDSHTQGKRPFKRITLSINQFIPKATTPFQWQPLEDINSVKMKTRKIENELRRVATVRVTHDLPKWNYIQALLALGDRRVGGMLLAVHRNEGNWPKALKECIINPDFFVYRRKSPSEILPWDFIDHGTDKSFLLHEYEESLSNKG